MAYFLKQFFFVYVTNKIYSNYRYGDMWYGIWAHSGISKTWLLPFTPLTLFSVWLLVFLVATSITCTVLVNSLKIMGCFDNMIMVECIGYLVLWFDTDPTPGTHECCSLTLPCHRWAEERGKTNKGLMSLDKDWEKTAKSAQLKVIKWHYY